MLKADLDKIIVELSRERHQVEKLQDQVNGQSANHKQIIELLMKHQSSTVDELAKKGGLLENVLNAENLTQTK